METKSFPCLDDKQECDKQCNACKHVQEGVKKESPPIANVLLAAGFTLEDGEYYKINGTKKILYWDGKEWMKPEKDNQKRYGGWNRRLEKQPTVKTVELVDILTYH